MLGDISPFGDIFGLHDLRTYFSRHAENSCFSKMFSTFRGIKARIPKKVLAILLAKLQKTISNIFPRVNQIFCL